MEHPAVADHGVIGKPHPKIGELVMAFISLKTNFKPNEDLRMELIGFGLKRLGSTVFPKEINVISIF